MNDEAVRNAERDLDPGDLEGRVELLRAKLLAGLIDERRIMVAAALGDHAAVRLASTGDAFGGLLAVAQATVRELTVELVEDSGLVMTGWLEAWLRGLAEYGFDVATVAATAAARAAMGVVKQERCAACDSRIWQVFDWLGAECTCDFNRACYELPRKVVAKAEAWLEDQSEERLAEWLEAWRERPTQAGPWSPDPHVHGYVDNLVRTSGRASEVATQRVVRWEVRAALLKWALGD